MTFRIGLLIFPNITQLDATGPYEVFIKFPDAEVRLIWKSLEPVKAGGGMLLTPDTTFADCPQLDLICVPGGAGMNPLLNDDETLEFIRTQARGAKYVTSVCTGSLVLGAAGLLKGKRATSHWMSVEMLEAFGAIPVKDRVVRDGNIITGGGITENLPRVLPKGCAAEIDSGSWPLPALFAWLRGLGRLPDDEMLRTFNCGIGMILVAPPRFETKVRNALRRSRLRHFEIGEVIKGRRRVRYRNSLK